MDHLNHTIGNDMNREPSSDYTFDLKMTRWHFSSKDDHFGPLLTNLPIFAQFGQICEIGRPKLGLFFLLWMTLFLFLLYDAVCAQQCQGETSLGMIPDQETGREACLLIRNHFCGKLQIIYWAPLQQQSEPATRPDKHRPSGGQEPPYRSPLSSQSHVWQ